MSDAYEYFEKEGAFFRRPKGSKARSVQHVYNRKSSAWENYTGDRLAPVAFGNKVSEEEMHRAIDLADPALKSLPR